MKKIHKLLIIPVVILFVLHACTDGFEDINKNPNKTEVTEPEYIFGLTPVATLKVLSSNSNWFFFGNYTNQLSVVGGGGPHFGKDGRSDGLWQNLYVQGLNPLFKIVNDYGDNPAYSHRVAIAKIWRSYIFSQLVAMWGPVPYTHACNEGPYMKYDDEATIYRGILAELKEAYTALAQDAISEKDTYPVEAEPFLGSDITKWSKFAHCIRLRVAFRIAEVEESVAPGLAAEARAIMKEEFENAEKGLLISSNAENFFMQFQQDTENSNPFFREVTNHPDIKVVEPGNFPVIHESLIMWMQPKTYNDPCIGKYMKKGDGGTKKNPFPEYFGRPYANGQPQGYQWPTGKTNPYDAPTLYDNFSTVYRDFAGQTAQFPFFTYPEIVYMKADAKYRGTWEGPKTAEEYYYELIDARCNRFEAKAADVTRYKDFPGIKWSTPSDTITRVDPEDEDELLVDRDAFRDFLGLTDSYLGGAEDNYKRIVVQGWLNFFFQGVDCWTLLRRTQVMNFKPHWNADTSTGYVSGTYAYMPHRLAYPDAERARNTSETQAAIDNLLLDNTLKDPLDQIPFKLIFAKDNPGLMSVPMNGGLVSFPNTARNRR